MPADFAAVVRDARKRAEAEAAAQWLRSDLEGGGAVRFSVLGPLRR